MIFILVVIVLRTTNEIKVEGVDVPRALHFGDIDERSASSTSSSRDQENHSEVWELDDLSHVPPPPVYLPRQRSITPLGTQVSD